MERLNTVWHQAHPMPKPATTDQRVAWHQEHSRVCSCREMPASIREEIERRRQPG